MTNINNKNTKVRTATIAKISTCLNDTVPCLNVSVELSYSDGGVSTSFCSNIYEDMLHLNKLFYYTDTDKDENVNSLKDKQVRVVIKDGILTAIGHPTKDEFFQIHDYNCRLPLSKII